MESGMGFLEAQTLAKVGAKFKAYPREFTISAAAGGSGNTVGSGPISIQNRPFFAERFLCSFPTTILSGGNVVDDGVCRLTLQLEKNSGVQVFDSPGLLSLFSSPGRQTVAGATAVGGGVPQFGQAPQFEGMPIPIFLAPGSKFTHTFFNKSDVAAIVNVIWWGYELDPAYATEEDFWAEVARMQPAPRGF